MNKSTPEKDDFYAQWEQKREKKWLHILVFGVLCCGGLLGSLFYFTKIHFQFSAFNLADYLERLLTSSIIGCIIVYMEFNRREKEYLNRDNDQTD